MKKSAAVTGTRRLKPKRPSMAKAAEGGEGVAQAAVGGRSLRGISKPKPAGHNQGGRARTAMPPSMAQEVTQFVDRSSCANQACSKESGAVSQRVDVGPCPARETTACWLR